MLPNSVSYRRAKPFKVLAAAPGLGVRPYFCRAYNFFNTNQGLDTDILQYISDNNGNPGGTPGI